jgi:two-component system, NarL family, response regulator DesR
MIRVLIAEDQAMVRGALASLLSLEPDIEVVAEVDRGDEVLAAATTARPDVALLDIEMPGCDGLAAGGRARPRAPGDPRRDPDHVRSPRIPAPGARAGRLGLPAEGRPREREVLAAAARHDSAAAIASSLHLTEGTVRNYLSASIRKLGARNRAEAIAVARDKGWL